MRKLKLQMQLSLDGFVAGIEGQLDWITPPTDKKQLNYLQKLTEGMDTILMGRRMADGFTTYWESVVDSRPNSLEYPYAKIFVDTPKIVFSKTITSINGRNARIETSDLVEAVTTLKKQTGKDMIVYGGANFVSELIKNKLIDDLHLFVNPTAIGNGLKIFNNQLALELVESDSFSDGIVFNHYQIKY